jgi:hypothetical protein
MKLTIYGFLVCLVLTIPTMGISLVLYFAAKYFIDQAGVEKLSIAIESSRNSNNSARVVIYVNNAAIKSFLRNMAQLKPNTNTLMASVRGCFPDM